MEYLVGAAHAPGPPGRRFRAILLALVAGAAVAVEGFAGVPEVVRTVRFDGRDVGYRVLGRERHALVLVSKQ